jgi:Domain of unknown function (DUF4920)
MVLIFTLVGCLNGPADAAPRAAPPATAAPAAADWKHFGAPFTVATAVPAATVLADPAAHTGGTVRITGELTEVCQSMGCWAVVRDDAGRSVCVTMKGHSFGIDKDTAGRDCDVEGSLVKKAVDPKTVEHYASEGSTNAPEKGKTEVYELVATGVSVARS